VAWEGEVGRADHAQPAADRLPHGDGERGRLEEPEPAVGDDERAAQARGALGVLDVDAHAEGERASRQVHELGVAAERVDLEAPVEATAGERQRRVERLHPVVGGDVRDGVGRGSHATSSAGRSTLTVPHSYSSAQISIVERSPGSDSTSRARAPSPARPFCISSSTWGGTGAPAASARRRAASPPGPSTGGGMRPPGRAACRGLAAPRPTTLTGPSTPRSTASTMARAASSWWRSTKAGSASAG